jgi:hypothetical protein
VLQRSFLRKKGRREGGREELELARVVLKVGGID